MKPSRHVCIPVDPLYLKHLLSVVVEHIYDTDPAYLEDLMPWSENLPDICKK